MFYLVTQLLLLLAIASLLSGAIGWLCRRYFTEQAHQDEILDHQRAGRHQVAQIDDLRRELTDRNTQVASLNSKLHYNKEAMDQASAERDNLLQDIEELQGLEDQLNAVEHDRALLDQQLADAEAELDQARRAQIENENALQHALAEKEHKLSATAANAKDAEQKLSAALATGADKEKQLKQLAADKAATEQQLRDAAVAAAENEEKLRSAASVNANLEDIITSLNEDIKAKTAEREDATKKYAQLSARLDQLEQKLAQTEQAGDAKISELEKSLRAEQGVAATAKQAVAAGEEKLKSLNITLADRTRERDNLEKRSNQQQQEIAALSRDIANAQKAAADAQLTGQKQVADLEHELDKQKTAAMLAGRQSANESQAKGQIEKALEKLQDELKASQNQFTDGINAAAERLEQQKQSTADSNLAAAAAEKQLAELKEEHRELKRAADARLQDLHNSKTESAKLAEKIASAEARIADLENRLAKQAKDADATEQQLRRDLDTQAGKLGVKESELRDAVSQSQELQGSLADYQSNDAALRATIEKLQAMLSEERRSAGQTLLSRIRELETMLEAERRKADEMRTAGPELGEVSWRSKSSVRTTAANSSTVSSKKSGTSD